MATYARYHDEPEIDYDEGATELYRCIENKHWDGALSRLEMAPLEAKTWVFRREPSTNKVRWRLLPLHAVCIFRAPLALIEALIEVYSDGPRMKDDQGMLPVHLACRNGASKGVVLTLLSSFPESMDVCDRKGRSPKDLVNSSTSANKEAVLNAVQRFSKEATMKSPSTDQKPLPSGATSSLYTDTARSEIVSQQTHEVDYEHRTTLFRLILKKEWSQVISRAKNFPGEAATWIVTKGFHGNLRFLPLHKACVLQPPRDVIEVLISAYSEGAAEKDQDGWLPIHCAAFYGADENVANALLTANGKGSQTKDDEGRLPLHYACLKSASQAVVDILLASYAKGTMSKDNEGRLPIHHACSKGAPENVIDVLLKSSPKGAQSKDDQGRLPLHHACRKNATERIIRTLLRVYPRASQIKDDQDKLPLHYACQHGATPAVVSILLSTYPESIGVKNGFGFTPLGEAKLVENAKMDPVIKLLEKFKRGQDKITLESCENSILDAKISTLNEKVASLEATIDKVSELGKDMRHDLKKQRDPVEVLERFANKLLDLRLTKAKFPLKGNQSTTKGLFRGRLLARGEKAK